MQPRIPITATEAKMLMYVEHAKAALRLKEKTGFSNPEVANLLRTNIGISYDPSSVGKLINAARLLRAYPAIEYWRLRDSNRLYDLHKIPAAARAQAFSTGYVTLSSGLTVNIYTTDRFTWNLALSELRSGSMSPSRLNEPIPNIEELRS